MMERGLSRRSFTKACALTCLAGMTKFAQEPASAIPKLDIHVHLGRDRQEMFRLTRDVLNPAVKYLLTEMDKHNIEKSLIVAVEPVFPTELYLEAARLAPDRLLVCCSVMPRPQNRARELLKRYRDQGAIALKLQPMMYDPADPAVEELVHQAVEYEMPVLFHHTDLPKTFPGMLAHFATTFQEGNFVVIHFGGIYGFWDVLPLARFPNVYLETSTAFHQVVNSPLRQMLHFLQRNQLNKLIFGSEHPQDYQAVFEAVQTLAAGATREILEAIYRENARKILNLA